MEKYYVTCMDYLRWFVKCYEQKFVMLDVRERHLGKSKFYFFDSLTCKQPSLPWKAAAWRAVQPMLSSAVISLIKGEY